MKFITYITLLFVFSTHAQMGIDYGQIRPIINDSNALSIETYANGHYESTVFSNEFFDKLQLGGYIDNELKDNSLNRAMKHNFVGGEGKTGILFTNRRIKLIKDFGIYGEFSTYNSGGAEFSKDLYQFSFYGNQSLAGDTIYLQQTSFHSRSFQKFSFGIVNENFTIGLGINNFSKSNYTNVEAGYIFTDSAITEISLDINGLLYESSSTRQIFQNGLGLGLDFEYRVPVSEFSDDSTDTRIGIVVGIKNLGINFLSKNNSLTDLDTSYQFNGVEINRLNDVTTSISNGTGSLDSIEFRKSYSKGSRLLPFQIYFYKPIIYGKKWQPIYGFRYLIQSNYRAYLYLGGSFVKNEKFNASSYVSYGGFGKFQWGLAINKNFKCFSLGIGTNNLLGLISKNQLGKAGAVSLKYLFK